MKGVKGLADSKSGSEPREGRPRHPERRILTKLVELAVPAPGRLRQEDCPEFQARMGSSGRPCLTCAVRGVYRAD